jgi:hypothetical protein
MGQTTATVILADVSSSMVGEPIRQLREKLGKVWASMRNARLLAFASDVIEIEAPAQLPEPAGGTALDLALECAARLRPFEILVISDGQPQLPEKALEIARTLPAAIQTLFIGDETRDPEAALFMRRLAAENGGRAISQQLSDNMFESSIRQLLGLPAPSVS